MGIEVAFGSLMTQFRLYRLLFVGIEVAFGSLMTQFRLYRLLFVGIEVAFGSRMTQFRLYRLLFVGIEVKTFGSLMTLSKCDDRMTFVLDFISKCLGNIK